MRKAVSIAAIMLASVMGTNASADVCEFLSPVDSGLRAGYAHYHCLGILGACWRVVYSGGNDYYTSATDDGNTCYVAALAWAERPFSHIFAVQGLPPVAVSVRGTAHWRISALPWSCNWGLCLLAGGVTAASYGPGLPRVHYRAWLFTMTYFPVY